MEVFTVTFTPRPAVPTAELSVTFSARWGTRWTTGVCDLALAHAQLTALLSLLQLYAAKAQRTARADEADAEQALTALALLPPPRQTPLRADALPRRLGEVLFAALFAPGSAARALWSGFYSSAGSRPQIEHRLVLHFIDRHDSVHTTRLFLALPWELMHEPQLEDVARRDLAVPLLLEQGRTLTLVRAYQPLNHLTLPQLGAAPQQRPAILLLETHDGALVSLAARVRPPELDQSQRALWCRLEAGGWPLAEGLPRGFKPQIVHVVGHGLRQEGRNWLLLGPQADGADEGLTGPYALVRALKQAGIAPALIASFVCLTATSPVWPPEPAAGAHAADAAPAQRPGYALLDALCQTAPALLLMQGLLDAEDAAVGSEAFYHALADGEGVARATRALRQRIYSAAEQPGRDLDAGWWLPTLYMANPDAEMPLVAPQPAPADEARQALALPAELIARIDRPVAGPRLIVVQCDAGGGKSVRLRRIADHLRAAQQRRLLMLPPYDGRAGAWLEAVQYDLATMLRALRFSPPHFSPPLYEQIVRAAGPSPPLFVLCDDGDKLPPAVWRGLLPEGICAPLIFVTTASRWPASLALPIEPEPVPLPPLHDDELRALQRPRIEQFASQRPPAVADDTHFRRLNAYLTFARVPLSIDTLAGIGEFDRVIVGHYLEHTARHQVAFQRSTDRRYELRVELAPLTEPAYNDFVAAVERYAQHLDEHDLARPADLYDIMLDHYQRIDPLPSRVREGPRLDRWVHLARVLIDHRGQAGAFARLALFRARNTPFTMVRDGLHYLILQRALLIPPELYGGWVWPLLWPASGAQLEGVPPGPELLAEEALPDAGEPHEPSPPGDDLEQLLGRLAEQPDLLRHPRLVTALRGRPGDDPLLARAYELHRRAIADRIQQEYEDGNLLAKRERTIQELEQVSSYIYSPVGFWDLAHYAEQRAEWLRKLEHRLVNFILVLDEAR